MISESIKPILILAIGLNIQPVSAVQAELSPAAVQADRYTLPPNKTHLELCRRNAMFCMPEPSRNSKCCTGLVIFLRYNIPSKDGSEWFLLCNPATGQIVQEQKLIDDNRNDERPQHS